MAVFPQLQNIAIDYVWGGTVDVPFDRMPHTRQIDGLYYAIGYAGHGVALATYLGAQMAATMGGATVDPLCRDRVSRCAAGAVRWPSLVPATGRVVVSLLGLGGLIQTLTT